MLNLRVAGNFLSTYYLAGAAQFLQAERGNLGEATREEGLRQVRRLLRRAALDLDDTSTLAATRKAVVPLLAALGFELNTGPATRVNDELTADAVVAGPDSAPLCYVVLAPASQHLDANPAGRRQGDARPQRRLERLLRHGRAPLRHRHQRPRAAGSRQGPRPRRRGSLPRVRPRRSRRVRRRA
jgi:hypothetical protein